MNKKQNYLELLQKELKHLPQALSFEAVAVTCNFYLFPIEGIDVLMTEHSHELVPIVSDKVLNTVFNLPKIEAIVKTSPEEYQYELYIKANSINDIVVSLEPLIAQLRTCCAEYDLCPFFIPKMDGLAGNNLIIDLLGIDVKTDAWKAAMLGLVDHSKPLTMIFCSQVNSYKRNTPQFLPANKRVPCYLRVTDEPDLNAIAQVNESEKVFSFYFADCHCDYEMVFVALLWMLRKGYENYSERFPIDKWTESKLSTIRMPNSLNVACKFWKDNPEPVQLLGSELADQIYQEKQLEWKTYCDIAHPWELLRGLAYER